MRSSTPDTAELIERASEGDRAAGHELLERHRGRLRKMVAVRLDRRLAARVDPSDVVQEVLAEAFGHLDEFLRERPLPFYAWLRQFAWQRLVKLHRRHIGSKKRSVAREEQWAMALPDDSALELADRLLARESSPIRRLIRAELRERLQEALAKMAPRDREILVMRNLEQLSIAEIAAALGINEGTVKVRHLRALKRLRELLEDPQ
jgi:RNA polymerase sigma-70 factor (ECF subfamily)